MFLPSEKYEKGRNMSIFRPIYFCAARPPDGLRLFSGDFGIGKKQKKKKNRRWSNVPIISTDVTYGIEQVNIGRIRLIRGCC